MFHCHCQYHCHHYLRYYLYHHHLNQYHHCCPPHHLLDRAAQLLGLQGPSDIDVAALRVLLQPDHRLPEPADGVGELPGEGGVEDDEQFEIDAEDDEHHQDILAGPHREPGALHHAHRFPARVSHVPDDDGPLPPLPGLHIIALLALGGLQVALRLQPRGDQGPLGVVDEGSIPVHQVDVSALRELYVAEDVLQGAVLQVDEQYAQLRVRAAGELHSGREGDDPGVLRRLFLEEPLDLRPAEVEIGRLLHSLDEPVLLGHRDILPHHHRRCRGQQPAGAVEEGDVLHIVAVGVVEQPDLRFYLLRQQIRALDDVIVQGVGEAEHISEVGVDGLAHLGHQPLVLLLHRAVQLGREADIEGHTGEGDGQQGGDRERGEHGRADAAPGGALDELPHPPDQVCPLLLPVPGHFRNWDGDMPKRFLNT